MIIFSFTNSLRIPSFPDTIEDPVKEWRKGIIEQKVIIVGVGRNNRMPLHKKVRFIDNVSLKILDFRFEKKYRKDPPIITIECNSEGQAIDVVGEGKIFQEIKTKKLLGQYYILLLSAEKRYGGFGGVAYTDKKKAYRLNTLVLELKKVLESL